VFGFFTPCVLPNYRKHLQVSTTMSAFYDSYLLREPLSLKHYCYVG